MLSTSVAVADILDPVRFREDFFFGLVLQHSVTNGDFAAAASRWAFVPPDKRPASQEEARSIIVNKLKGNVPDAVILQHLLYQLGQLEVQTGVKLTVERVACEPFDTLTGPYTRIGQRVPWSQSDHATSTRISVPGPVLSVERVRGVLNNTVVTEVPLNLVTIADRKQGHLSLGLNLGAMSATGMPWSYGLYATEETHLFTSPLRMNRPAVIPGFWAVDYTTGPTDGPLLAHVPIAIQFRVYCQAAIFLYGLNSNVVSKGIASQTRTVDGISNTISLTNSAMYDLNSAIELILSKYGDGLDPKALRRRMSGISVRHL